MKKTALLLSGILVSVIAFSQTAAVKPINPGKIQLSDGQKIIAASSIAIEADMGMGMQLNSNTASENILEVKSSTAKDYTITSTLTKLKVDFNMAGQSTNYDSEKNSTPSSDIEKTFSERLNKPVDVILDNTTGTATLKEKQKKSDGEEENPMGGLMNAFAESSDDAVVSGAFELIPAGKSIGDSWSDTTRSKEMTTIRNYTLRSVSGNDALIQLDAVTTASNKLDFQGMEFEFKSTTKSTGEITSDISTGQIKNKNTKADITGTIQLMGQDMPVTAKVTSTGTYK
ncbi:MAG: hypothetical protein KTQ13_12005 [Ferruginibacter sp.]|nr:hypothetical protein [Ferruginibacter sp.]MBU9937369.1 hypothetical protein [Ferruginibacter sp.]